MELRLKPIGADFPDMDHLCILAAEAFPPQEHIAPQELIEMAQSKGFDFWALYDGECFIGFMVVMTHRTMAYLFFLAIDASLRSQGYGGAALSKLQQTYPAHQHVVDMELLDNKADNVQQRIARRNFYIRNGYKPTGQYLSYFGVSYEVLCRDNLFDSALFEELLARVPVKDFTPRFFRIE